MKNPTLFSQENWSSDRRSWYNGYWRGCIFEPVLSCIFSSGWVYWGESEGMEMWGSWWTQWGWWGWTRSMWEWKVGRGKVELMRTGGSEWIRWIVNVDRVSVKIAKSSFEENVINELMGLDPFFHTPQPTLLLWCGHPRRVFQDVYLDQLYNLFFCFFLNFLTNEEHWKFCVKQLFNWKNYIKKYKIHRCVQRVNL